MACFGAVRERLQTTERQGDRVDACVSQAEEKDKKKTRTEASCYMLYYSVYHWDCCNCRLSGGDNLRWPGCLGAPCGGVACLAVIICVTALAWLASKLPAAAWPASR